MDCAFCASVQKAQSIKSTGVELHADLPRDPLCPEPAIQRHQMLPEGFGIIWQGRAEQGQEPVQKLALRVGRRGRRRWLRAARAWGAGR